MRLQKHAATRQVMQLPPCLAKVVAPNTALSSSVFKQYMFLDRLTEAEAQLTSTGDAIIINGPAKPVAGLSKHPDDTDNVDGKLIY